MALGGEGQPRARGQASSRGDLGSSTVAESQTATSDWPHTATDEMDEIELGPAGEGAAKADTPSTAKARFAAGSKQGDEGVSPLVRMSSAFGYSYKAQSFEWDVGECSVRLRGGGTRTILNKIVGRATSGSFTAILGPSGSGKTTLLDCLALRNTSFSGALKLDDKPPTSSFFSHTGYVHQTEMFMSHLTCREHLTFHSINRMSYKHATELCLARVDEVLSEVDLMRVADSQIGGGAFYVTKGLSGGERKRLNIATELISDPSILFLDEPTSGLDAVMGELVCVLLRQLALRVPKRIIMCSVHTPSSKMFRLFTHLLVLTSQGRLAYTGPREQMLPFLSGLGFECPPNYNPGDFMLELASAKVVKASLLDGALEAMEEGGAGSSEWKDATALGGEEDEEQQPTTQPLQGPTTSAAVSSLTDVSTSVEAVLVGSEAHLRLAEACAQQLLPHYRRLTDSYGSHHAAGRVSMAGGRSSFLTQFRMNTWRSWLQLSREVVGHSVGLLMNLILGLLFGILYLNQVQGSWRNTAGFLFALAVTLLISSAIQVTLHMPGDFMMLLRECYTGSNSAVPYFLGRSLSAMPFSLIYMGMAVVPYFMTGLARDASAFGWYLLICFLLIFGSQSIGYLSSSFSSNPVVGLATLPVLITPMILFSGMLYERHSVRPWLRWIQDLSLMNYSFATLVMNEARATGRKSTASLLLSFLQVDPKDWSLYLLLIFVLGLGYRCVALLILTYRVRNTKSI